MIDALHRVRAPTVEEEALRDLVRAREDVRGDMTRARQRLSKLLLRHGILYEDSSSTWTPRHRSWLRAQDLGAIDTLDLRRNQLEGTIVQLVPSSRCAHTVARLRCLREIDTLSAAGLAAEIGDFERFARAGQLMRDVLCHQPSGVLAGVGLPSSASRLALRATGSVTASPAIRWVAARSGLGPDELGMVTAMCCCRPRCLAVS